MLAEFNEISRQLETWYSGESGQYLLGELQKHLETELETAFGYHLVQVGVSRSQPLFGSCRIRHCIYSAPAVGGAVSLTAEADQLPLASDSVDVLIAHHALEFCDNPHQALREMHRVLTPQGHLYLIGFNPLSVAGGWFRLKGLAGHSLWGDKWHGLSRSRLQDWFSVLGLETVSVADCLALGGLWGGERVSRALENLDRWICASPLPLGGVYVQHALKQVPGNLRPAARVRRARLMDIAVPRPAPTPRKGDHAA